MAKTKQPPLMATKDELNARVEKIYNQINSFQATVDLTPSTGSVYKGEITEYRDVRGYVLFRKPEHMRIIGQYPVVRSTAFDMVSDGKEFRMSLPPKSLFVIGENAAPRDSPNKLENMRPQAFLDAMLIRPIEKGKEQAILLDDTDEDQSLYIMLIERNDDQGNIVPLRSVWFDRTNLQIIRQVVYSPDANTTSDTRYSNWADFGGVSFPKTIDINRPTDGYGVVLDVVKMEMNVPLTDQQFVLNQPPGSKLQVIGKPTVPQPAAVKSQK